MLARLPSLILVRLSAMLLLATVTLQAGEPVHVSLEQQHGSAFSAATYEVALAVSRNERATRQELPAQSSPPVLAPLAPSPPLALADTGQPAARPDARGPPARHTSVWRPAPRAPPYA